MGAEIRRRICRVLAISVVAMVVGGPYVLLDDRVAGPLSIRGTVGGAASYEPDAPPGVPTQAWFTNATSFDLLLTDSPSLARAFFDRHLGYLWPDSVPPGWVTTPYVNYGSYARFADDIASGQGPDVPILFYDPEKWYRTPLDEQRHPRAYMERFADLAHAQGYRIVNTPNPNLMLVEGAVCRAGPGEDIWTAFMRCRLPWYAAHRADGLDIQTQQWECSSVYGSRVRAAARQAREAHPSVDVYSGLSTGWCSPSPGELFAAWKSVSGTVKGHFMYIGDKNTLAGIDFLNLVQPVIVTDDAFVPETFDLPQGAQAIWRISYLDTRMHSIVDASGMSLFDSGLHGPGYQFSYVFIGAGGYPVKDGATGHRSEVRIPAIASPAHGGIHTTFTVQAATRSAPNGFVWVTQIQRPGGSFVYWRTGIVNSFTPDAGQGIYSFRTLLKRKSDGTTSDWSPIASINVSES